MPRNERKETKGRKKRRVGERSKKETRRQKFKKTAMMPRNGRLEYLISKIAVRYNYNRCPAVQDKLSIIMTSDLPPEPHTIDFTLAKIPLNA